MVCIRDSSLKKCAPLRREELIYKDDIDEVLYPLKESDTDYIVDGQFQLDKKDLRLKFRGSSNQRIWKKRNGEWCT